MITAQKFTTFLIILCFIFPEAMSAVAQKETLRIMSFNVWMSGSQVDNGLYKIAKHIKLVDPDIVALQEVDTPLVLKILTKRLGGTWVAHSGSGVYSDVGILTKHKVSRGKNCFWLKTRTFLKTGVFA